MTKVSIIVPIYNVDNEYLKKCIDSLINQTLKDIEIILVDDGSPNKENAMICDNYAKSDSRIVVVHKKNGGLSSARNAGFKIATGKYFTFVDGDDWLSNDACEIMYKTIIEKKVDMVVCKILREYKNTTTKFSSIYDCNRIYDREEIKKLQREVLRFDANNSAAYARLINTKKVLSAKILHDEELKQGAEGIEYNIRLYDCICSVVFIDEWLYHYRYDENSISNGCDEKNYYYTLRCFDKIKQNMNIYDKEIKKLFYLRMHYVIITAAISCFFNPDYKKNFFSTRKSFFRYLKDPLVIETMNQKIDLKPLGKSRIIVFYLIKMRLCLCLKILGFLRKYFKKKVK